MRKSLWIMLALLVVIGAPAAHADSFAVTFTGTVGAGRHFPISYARYNMARSCVCPHASIVVALYRQLHLELLGVLPYPYHMYCTDRHH